MSGAPGMFAICSPMFYSRENVQFCKDEEWEAPSILTGALEPEWSLLRPQFPTPLGFHRAREN